jgi:hypothetical protein
MRFTRFLKNLYEDITTFYFDNLMIFLFSTGFISLIFGAILVDGFNKDSIINSIGNILIIFGLFNLSIIILIMFFFIFERFYIYLREVWEMSKYD